MAVVTFPGEWQEELPSWPILPAVDEWGRPATEKDARGNLRTASFRDWVVNAKRVSLHDWLFNGKPDPMTRRRLPFSSTLVLPGLNVYEGLGIDDPEKVRWHDFVFRARGRDLNGAVFDLANLPKVDFYGADLHGASLSDAQLRGASLARAQLQGAKLDGAQLGGASLARAQLQGASLVAVQLQGASLADAELQGASLDEAELQGAWLENAQLQGASLNEAFLHGADLRAAQLQGASLKKAVLHGACLKNANLEGAALDGAYLLAASLVQADLTGASLADAQLQGASLGGAALNTTDLSNAFLWRATFGKASTFCGTTAESSTPATPATLRFPDAPEAWQPLWRDEHGRVQPWDNDVYKKRLEVVRTMFGEDQGRNDPVRDAMLIQMRGFALDRLGDLDCANSDLTLASCDPSVPPPTEVAARQKSLEAASVDDEAYATALAKVLRGLVCSRGEETINVVRGVGFQLRLSEAGTAAIDLIDDLTSKDSKDCPVSASLTDADKARLLQIKRDAIKEAGQ